MSKPYQDHNPIKDKGKAIPHLKQPTRYTYRGRFTCGKFHVSRDNYREVKRSEEAKRATSGRDSHVGVVGVLMAVISMLKANRGR